MSSPSRQARGCGNGSESDRQHQASTREPASVLTRGAGRGLRGVRHGVWGVVHGDVLCGMRCGSRPGGVRGRQRQAPQLCAACPRSLLASLRRCGDLGGRTPPAAGRHKPSCTARPRFTCAQGRGTVVTGRVEQGIVRTGDEVEIVGIRPQNLKSTVTGGCPVRFTAPRRSSITACLSLGKPTVAWCLQALRPCSCRTRGKVQASAPPHARSYAAPTAPPCRLSLPQAWRCLRRR